MWSSIDRIECHGQWNRFDSLGCPDRLHTVTICLHSSDIRARSSKDHQSTLYDDSARSSKTKGAVATQYCICISMENDRAHNVV
jgi:hypothetical protein